MTKPTTKPTTLYTLRGTADDGSIVEVTVDQRRLDRRRGHLEGQGYTVEVLTKLPDPDEPVVPASNSWAGFGVLFGALSGLILVAMLSPAVAGILFLILLGVGWACRTDAHSGDGEPSGSIDPPSESQDKGDATNEA